MTDKVWINVSPSKYRPPLAVPSGTKAPGTEDPMLNIVAEARTAFQAQSWSVADLNAMEQYVTGSGNPAISKELAAMTKEQRELYFATAIEVFKDHCETRTLWKDGNPTRPGILALIAKAKEKFTEKNWSLTRLNNIERYVNTQGNRAIGGIQTRMQSQQCGTNQTCYQAYSATVITTFAQACGLQQFNMPTLTNDLQQVTVGEQTVTLNGTDLPKDAKIVLTDGTTDYAPTGLQITEVKTADDGTSVTFKLTLPEAAIGKTLGVKITHPQYEQLTASQNDAFMVLSQPKPPVKAPINPPVVPTEQEDPDKDIKPWVRKLNPRVSLGFDYYNNGATDQSYLPLTLTLGVAPMIIGKSEMGPSRPTRVAYVESNKVEVNASARATGGVDVNGEYGNSPFYQVGGGVNGLYSLFSWLRPEGYANASYGNGMVPFINPLYYAGNSFFLAPGARANFPLGDFSLRAGYEYNRIAFSAEPANTASGTYEGRDERSKATAGASYDYKGTKWYAPSIRLDGSWIFGGLHVGNGQQNEQATASVGGQTVFNYRGASDVQSNFTGWDGRLSLPFNQILPKTLIPTLYGGFVRQTPNGGDSATNWVTGINVDLAPAFQRIISGNNVAGSFSF
ncbi:MAG: hypothetical protein WC500_02520 [Candidatus Margulisiibacteriota bacterium]